MGAVWLGIPLPWMLGPLLFIAVIRLKGIEIVSSPTLRNIGQWVIGTSLGLYFTPTMVGMMANHVGAMLSGMIFALSLGVYGTFVIRKYGKVDLKTAWFAAALGGASEMTSLAERYGGRPDLVASAHSLRILTVVLILPAVYQLLGVAGQESFLSTTKVVNLFSLILLFSLTGLCGAMAERCRLPNSWVIGPMLAAMALTMGSIELSAIPDWLLKVAQVLIGWSLGERFKPGFFLVAPRFLMTVISYTTSALGFAFLLSLCLAHWSDLPLSELLLGLAPGGIAEMAITAKVLHLGVPMVTAFQVSRMVIVVIVTGPLYSMVVSRYFPAFGQGEQS